MPNIALEEDVIAVVILHLHVLWSRRSGDVATMSQAVIEITCHDHSTTAQQR